MIKLLKKKGKTKYEKMLLAALCSMTVDKRFSHLTSEQIFNWLLKQAILF